MRILRILHGQGLPDSAPQARVEHLDAALAQLGHAVDLLRFTPDPSAPTPEPSAPTHLRPYRFVFRLTNSLANWLRAHAHGYDAIIINGAWQHHGLGTWRALAQTAVPYFVFTNGMLGPWFRAPEPSPPHPAWCTLPWVGARILRDAAAVIFTCEAERWLAQQGQPTPQAPRPSRSHEAVVGYGTDAPPSNAAEGRRDFLSAHPHLRGRRLLLYQGSLQPAQGSERLLLAVAQVVQAHPLVHVIMAGPDPSGSTAHLQQQAAQLGIAHHITWPGALHGHDHWGACFAAEAFCQPAQQPHFGSAATDALGCGKPVIISTQVAIWHEVKAAGAGIVHPDTLTGAVRALNAWLTLPPSSQAHMSAAALRCFNTQFRIDPTAQRLLSGLANPKPRPPTAPSPTKTLLEHPAAQPGFQPSTEAGTHGAAVQGPWPASGTGARPTHGHP